MEPKKKYVFKSPESIAKMVATRRVRGYHLTEADVREIRRRYAAREVNQPQLAREYGVSTAEISAICRRIVWTHVV